MDSENEWNPSILAVLGTVENNIYLLHYRDVMQSPPNSVQANVPSPQVASASMSLLHCSHNGKVKRLAVHPLISSLFASISADGSVRLWDSLSMRQLSVFSFAAVLGGESGGAKGANCIVFTPDGRMLVIGDDAGQLCLFECDFLHNSVDAHRRRENRKSKQKRSGDKRRQRSEKLIISTDSDSDNGDFGLLSDQLQHNWSLVMKRGVAPQPQSQQGR